jgi:glycosyltransferase involved in cell wall biosynthesis|tara:strand:- start:892 stop:1983 length:1092 start_codon:yes stop_codon:yes gene_type:complete
MKKKILFVMHELNLGGAERVIANIVNNFDSELYDINLCLFKKKGDLISEIKDGIEIHDLNAKRVITSFFSYYKLILKIKPDIVFTSITHVNLLTSLLIPFIKLNICFITREVNNPSIRSSFKFTSKVMDSFYRYSISNFNYIIAQSNFMKSDIINHYKIDENRIHAMPNPLDINSIKSRLLEQNDDICFDKNKKNLLALGGLRKQKGFEKLIKIMKFLDESYQLTIIGEGPERGLLEDLIKSHKLEKKVRLLGKKSNPYIYMKNCDVFLISSNYEGFPNVIIEANVCGKFVIANNCPGINNEIIKSNVNGVILDFMNYEVVSKYIKDNFLNLSATVIPIEITEKYDARNIANRYHNLIKKYFN